MWSWLATRRNALLRRIPAITYPMPTASSASPSTLVPAGGETVTVTGTGFRVQDGHNGWIWNVTQVLFSDSSAATAGTSLSVVSETSLTIVAPALSAGTYFIQLRSLGGDAIPTSVSVASTARILLETGDDLLLETGDALRTE